MATIDLTTPIDVQAVIGAVKKYKDLLVTLDSEDANEVLQHFTPIPSVTDSIVLGRTTLSKISHKYTGHFIGQKTAGKIVPRTLKVYPCVMEMDDEPERYRRTYITEVKGGLDPTGHPFEIWLINYGIKCASQELYNDMLMATYDADTTKTDLSTSFDGILTILQAEITAKTIDKPLGNMYATGVLAVTDIGTKLLNMWRSMPSSFRKKKAKLFLSSDLADMYDDWLGNQGMYIQGSDFENVGAQYLRNTHGKVEIVRLDNMPDGSQFCFLTTQLNVCYGYDKDSDFKSMIPVNIGNPYHFTAAGKYVLGFQFVSLDKSEFCCNDQPITPA